MTTSVRIWMVAAVLASTTVLCGQERTPPGAREVSTVYRAGDRVDLAAAGGVTSGPEARFGGQPVPFVLQVDFAALLSLVSIFGIPVALAFGAFSGAALIAGVIATALLIGEIELRRLHSAWPMRPPSGSRSSPPAW